MIAATNYDPIQTVLDKLECVTPSGEGKWMARCPAHDDGRPSLQIARGENGNCLVKCYASCESASIVKSMDMTMAELFADYGQKKHQPERKSASFSRVVARYDYFDEGRNLIYQVRRLENKQFPQYRPDGKNGWIAGLSRETRRLLFRLPELLEADLVDPVFVVEGEKDVLNLVKLGLVATSKSGGSNGVWPKDLNRHFQGRHVIVIPDNDEAGRASADGICRQLKAVAKSLKLLDLAHYWDGMPVKADVSDWLEKAAGNRAKLLELVGKTPEWEFADSETDDLSESDDISDVLIQNPFPITALPYEWALIGANCAEACNVDPSGFGVLMLAVAAGMVGGAAKMRCRQTWEESLALWCLLVGESGTGKTTVIDFLKSVHDEIDYENITEFKRRFATWKSDSDDYQKAKRKRSGVPDDIRDPGPEPQCPRLAVQDATVESLIPILASNEAGLTLINDELSGWLAGFGGYNKGRAAADMAFFNQAYSGTSYRNDRKGNGCTFLRRPLLSICGGVQPGMMAQVMSSEHKSSGLLARVLIAWPPKRIIEWSDREVDWGTREDYKQLVMRLLMFRKSRIRPAHHQGEHCWQGDSNLTGEVDPVAFEFTDDALGRFKEYFNQLGLEAGDFTGDLSSAWAKLRGMTMRIAGVLHLMEWASSKAELEPSPFVTLETLENAIMIVDWLKSQTKKLYAAFANNDPTATLKRQQQDREVAETEWLKRKIINSGGEIQVREFCRNSKWKTIRANNALARLEAEEWGRFESRPSAHGRSTRWFIFNSSVRR